MFRNKIIISQKYKRKKDNILFFLNSVKNDKLILNSPKTGEICVLDEATFHQEFMQGF